MTRTPERIGSRESGDDLADPARLAAVQATDLLDAPPEVAFDRLTRLATRLLDAPVALVSLVTDDRQFFPACTGLPEPWATRRETPLSHSFCQHVVRTAEPLVVEDAREHPELRENLAIADLDVVAYAGVPLTTSTGHVLGSFCAIDSRPRAWTAEDLGTLQNLAAAAMSELERTVDLAPGDALLLYTDGLTESNRRATLEPAEVGALLTGEPSASAEAMAVRLRDAALERAGGDLPDDLAILVVRVRPGCL